MPVLLLHIPAGVGRVSISKEASVEARRLEPHGPQNPSQIGPYQEPFGWRLLFHLVHPCVWAVVAAVWVSAAALVFYEAG
jgi:hypothetical protein